MKALREFVANHGSDLTTPYGHSYRGFRGDRVICKALAEWFENPEIPDKQIGLNWFKDLPELLQEAFDEFRTLPEWHLERSAYLIDTEGSKFPDLVNIHDDRNRTLTIMCLVDLMSAIYCKVERLNYDQARWLEHEMTHYYNAQWQIIEQSWKRFVKKCYRPFIRRYKDERHSANSGTFGSTRLLTLSSAGRVMFTFARGDEDMTYVADDSDLYGNRAGPNYVSIPYTKCVEMIDDVVNNWDLDKLVRDDEVFFW